MQPKSIFQLKKSTLIKRQNLKFILFYNQTRYIGYGLDNWWTVIKLLVEAYFSSPFYYRPMPLWHAQGKLYLSHTIKSVQRPPATWRYIWVQWYSISLYWLSTTYVATLKCAFRLHVNALNISWLAKLLNCSFITHSKLLIFFKLTTWYIIHHILVICDFLPIAVHPIEIYVYSSFTVYSVLQILNGIIWMYAYSNWFSRRISQNYFHNTSSLIHTSPVKHKKENILTYLTYSKHSKNCTSIKQCLLAHVYTCSQKIL